MFPTLAQSLNMNSLHLYSAGQVQLEANHKLVHYYCKSTVEPWWCWAVLPLPLRGCFLLFLLTGPLTFPDSPKSLVCPVHDQQLKSSSEYQEVNRHEGSYISIPVIFSITAHLLFFPHLLKEAFSPGFRVISTFVSWSYPFVFCQVFMSLIDPCLLSLLFACFVRVYSGD